MHRRAQTATIRTSRYLDSILKVNQQLVATTSGMPEPQQPSPAQLFKSRAPRATQREKEHGHGPSARRVGTVLEGVSVGAAVGEAVMVGRAGGNPVPSLTALYERIGFCAIQAGDSDDEGMESLPTSPSRAVAGNTHKEHRVQSDDEGIYRRRLGNPDADGFFPSDGAEELGSPARWATGRKLDIGSSRPSESRGDHGKGNGIKGYSFAHSPIARVTSVGERSPKVLKRLEALASQLERERADVEQWYKNVVHRVGLSQRHRRLSTWFLRAESSSSPRRLLSFFRTTPENDFMLLVYCKTTVLQQSPVLHKQSVFLPHSSAPSLHIRRSVHLPPDPYNFRSSFRDATGKSLRARGGD